MLMFPPAPLLESRGGKTVQLSDLIPDSHPRVQARSRTQDVFENEDELQEIKDTVLPESVNDVLDSVYNSDVNKPF